MGLGKDITPLRFEYGAVYKGYSLWHAYNNQTRTNAVATLYIPSWKGHKEGRVNIYLRTKTFNGIWNYWVNAEVYIPFERSPFLDVQKLTGNTKNKTVDMWMSRTKEQFDQIFN